MVNINKYIKALLHPAGGHQGSHKIHQAFVALLIRDLTLFYNRWIRSVMHFC